MAFSTFGHRVGLVHLIQRTINHQERQGAKDERPLLVLSIDNGELVSFTGLPVGYGEITLLAVFESHAVELYALIQAGIPAQRTLESTTGMRLNSGIKFESSSVGYKGHLVKPQSKDTLGFSGKTREQCQTDKE